MTDHTTHDLAIARAERDAWQSTCEELHRTIAGRDVEIEAHLGRCEAADQRARSLDAALTAEREAGRGLVAQVDALRKDLAHAQERLAERRTAQRGEVERLEAERDRLRDELRAIRDLVAPGNPQGTVVDAVRAMATGLIESIGARDAAEQARDMARDSRDAAIARAEAAERTLSGLYDDSKAELAKLRAELAELTAARDRLLAREHEDGRLHAQLRVELAELRARPVLTVKALDEAMAMGAGAGAHVMAKLGAVTLPSPDRAEELCRAYHDRMSIDGKPPAPAWNEFSAEARVTRVTAMRLELAALAKLSPAPAREVAPTLVAVSDEELATAYSVAHDQPIPRMAPLRDRTIAGIRAVRAKLGAAEVTEERVKAALKLLDGITSSDDLTDDESLDDRVTFFMTSLRATAAKGG